MHAFRNRFFVCTFAAAFLPGVCLAEDPAPLKLTPQPGKQVCQAASTRIGEQAGKVELCVIGGKFSHDTYILAIDGKPLLKGIDDETTAGLSGTYRGDAVSLICAPQIEGPKEVDAEKIAAYQNLFRLSAEKARERAILAESVEVGRLCTARAGSTPVLAVQVMFE